MKPYPIEVTIKYQSCIGVFRYVWLSRNAGEGVNIIYGLKFPIVKFAIVVLECQAWQLLEQFQSYTKGGIRHIIFAANVSLALL